MTADSTNIATLLMALLGAVAVAYETKRGRK